MKKIVKGLTSKNAIYVFLSFAFLACVISNSILMGVQSIKWFAGFINIFLYALVFILTALMLYHKNHKSALMMFSIFLSYQGLKFFSDLSYFFSYAEFHSVIHTIISVSTLLLEFCSLLFVIIFMAFLISKNKNLLFATKILAFALIASILVYSILCVALIAQGGYETYQLANIVFGLLLQSIPALLIHRTT